jgi:hypothetical protein
MLGSASEVLELTSHPPPAAVSRAHALSLFGVCVALQSSASRAALLAALIDDSVPTFEKISKRNAERPPTENECGQGAWDEEGKQIECG